jgi:hypothetical protein
MTTLHITQKAQLRSVIIQARESLESFLRHDTSAPFPVDSAVDSTE